jgi:GntR family transcriptional regulator
VVYRKQGAGTFVNRPGLRIKSRLEEIWSYEAVLKDHGYTPSTRVLGLATIQAGSEAAELLLEPQQPVVEVRKLFLEDKEPVIFTRNLIPLERLLGQQPAAEEFHAPLFLVFERHTPHRLSYYLSDIVPVTANGELAETLDVPAQTPLISFEEVGYSEANEPIVKAYSYFRDDLLRLRILRRKV